MRAALIYAIITLSKEGQTMDREQLTSMTIVQTSVESNQIQTRLFSAEGREMQIEKCFQIKAKVQRRFSKGKMA